MKSKKLKENLEIIHKKCFNNPDFTYWIGVAQSDGHFKKQISKNQNRVRFSIILKVGLKSIPMLEKFRKISQDIFYIKGSSYTYTTPEGFTNYNYQFGCKNLLSIFNNFEINFKICSPPDWILKDPKLFGSYLAGVIDGDGDIRITRPKYPQCFVRISSGQALTNLTENIKSILNCGSHIVKRQGIKKIANRKFFSTGYVTEFKISSKNISYIKKYVIDYLALTYKRNKINEYIKIKRVAAEI